AASDVYKRQVFHQVLVTTFPEGGFPTLEKTASMVVDLPERPSDFRRVQKEADKMGFFELRSYIKKLNSEGYDVTRYLTDLHGKVAFSLVSLLMVVIGLCFSLRPERSGTLAQSIGAGIVIGFSYWFVFAFALSLGRSGTIPPALAAWAANIVFGAAAIYLVRRTST
ncbi:MAG: LptF/LptG family permease, partial [Syntrophales bacterium]|nr:LptF/LptG family permease [Syntrophales bacterium]